MLSDDTDVLVLLLRYCHQHGLTKNVTMEYLIKQGAMDDICATVMKNLEIIPDILPVLELHELSCCDIVALVSGRRQS